jgi:hypothetical protein
MPKDFATIYSIMQQRRDADSTLIRGMIEVRDRYNGDVVVSATDVSGEPTFSAPSPRLVADGIDNGAMRAASPRPTIFSPALTPSSERSRARARARTRALYAAWHHNALWDVKLYRSYRHLFGYGTCALIVMPDHETGRATIELRDPLAAYPELRSPDDIRAPNDVGFIFGRSKEWLLSHYPEARQYMTDATIKSRNGREYETLWDVCEWIDQDDIVIGILGPRQPSFGSSDWRVSTGQGYELRRWKNLAGVVPGAIPRRVTLDRIAGQMANIIPISDILDRLNTLDMIAAEKAIFPDMVVQGRDGRPPQLVSGPWQDGRTGNANVVTDAEVKLLQSAPGPLTHPVIDRIESAARGSGGISSLAAGMNPGSLRTGRALSQMGEFSIDPRVEEAQKVMARALMNVNEGIIAVEKGYFAKRKIVGFTGWGTDESVIEYTPEEVFDNSENVVQYDFPGSDAQSTSVVVGQMVGAELMSKATARRKHPYIEDPDHEESKITVESLRKTLLVSLEQRASQGEVPEIDVAYVIDCVVKGETIEQAVLKAQQKAQERQATPAPSPVEQQPGLANPGVGAEQPAPPTETVDSPGRSALNFRELVNSLNAGRGR